MVYDPYEPGVEELEGEIGGWSTPQFQRKRRQLEYKNRFSVRLTSEERSAARVRVTLITTLSKSKYLNEQYSPHRGLYWRYTAHNGDLGVIRTDLVQFQKQIIYDFVNDSLIVNYWSNVTDAILRRAIDAYSVSLAQAQVAASAWGVAVAESYNLSVRGWFATLQGQVVQAVLGRAAQGPTGPLDSTWVLRTPGFQCPETLWKFTGEGEDCRALVQIDHWPFREVPALFVAAPAPHEEEGEQGEEGDNEFPDSPPAPTPENPPSEDQSDQDPRNDEDDYDSAPAPEEEFPPGTIWRCRGEGVGQSTDPGGCGGNGQFFTDFVVSTSRPYFVVEGSPYAGQGTTPCPFARIYVAGSPAVNTFGNDKIGYWPGTGTIELQ